MSAMKEAKDALDNAGLVSQAEYDILKRDYLRAQLKAVVEQLPKWELLAKEESQKREAEADLQAYALESIVKHASSLMSEEQKVDLVRHYVRMYGLERLPADSAGAPGAEPASKGRNYRCSKRGQHKKGHICPFAKKPKVQAGAIAGGASAQAGTSGSVQQQQQGLMAWSHYLLPYQQRAENDEPPSKRQRSSTEERDASLPGSSMPPDEPTPAEEDEYSSYSDDDREVDSDADEQRTGKQGYKRWTEEDDIALVAALRAGQTASTIEIGGRQAGTAFDRLHRAKVNGYGAPVLREYLEKPRRDSSGATEPWSAEEDLTFIQAHRDGKTQREIAAMLPGRSYHAVTGRWKEAKKPGGKYGSAALRAYAAAYCKSKKPVS